MGTHKMPRKAFEKAMATKPPKHIRVSGDGNKKLKFNADRLIRLAQKHGLDPGEVVFEGLKSDGLTEKEKTEIALRLMEYIYAKRKATEVSGDDGGPVELKITWAKPQDK